MSLMQTVSPLSILFMCVSLLLCFGMPVGLAVWAKVRYRKAFSFLPMFVGALCFFVSQIIIRIPLMQYVMPLFGWYKAFMKMEWPFLITACFTAGLFEEPARFIAFSVMRKRREYTDGLSYGIGHGGIEAIFLVGVSSVLNNIIASLMINTGSAGSLFPQTVVTALVSTPSWMFLLGGVERIFAVFLHIALSLLVLRGFQTNKRALYLVAAILLHGLANTAALATMKLAGVFASEGVLLIIAAISILYITKQARDWRGAQPLPQKETYEQPGQTDTP